MVLLSCTVSEPGDAVHRMGPIVADFDDIHKCVREQACYRDDLRLQDMHLQTNACTYLDDLHMPPLNSHEAIPPDTR
jgi:hypothetical protein